MAVDSNARLLAIALAGQGGEGTSDYTQLSNKPKINNVVLVGNKSLSDLGINIPVNVSDLTNDAGYITNADITGKANVSDLADVAFSGDYDDLENKPTIPVIPTNVSYFINDAGYLTQHQDISHLATKAEITGKANISDLSEVAFSGDYDDLSNTPTIPVNVSDLNNDSGFITSASITGKEDISNKVTSVSSSSTDTEYPTAKCLYDALGNIESALEALL